MTVQTAVDAPAKTFTLPFQDGLTAFGILQAAEVPVVSSGSGETCFVSEIDGIENEGSSGDNWIFMINQELGDRSSDAIALKPGDQVLWRFGDYDNP